ncbi:LytTR family DNA-binding domain-containing protein [Pseudomonas frederiksbergensis]
MMQLRCYRNLVHSLVDAAEFVAFKAESKYVHGVMANGDEYLVLPDRISLKELLGSIPGLMRVSRSVLVARRHVERVAGTRDERCVHAAGKKYRLSRDELPDDFESAAIENTPVFILEKNRVVAISRSREKWCLPVRVRLVHLERTVPGLMRVNSVVLVARTQVERVTGTPGERRIRVAGMVYSFSREVDPVPFQIAASENTTKRRTKFRAPRLRSDHPRLPLNALQMASHGIAV